MRLLWVIPDYHGLFRVIIGYSGLLWGFVAPYTCQPFYIMGTYSNNALLWFTKRILGIVFLCSYNVCPK